jgi:molybdate transport repressor ModE-like protein
VEDHHNQVLPVTARVRLTLHTGERFFGPGVCELLERIRKTGSIQAAAAEMEMSYTKAWRILNRAEREMGVNLITRVSGGKRGGSSTLTEAGERAVCDFREMEARLCEAADALLAAHGASFAPDGDRPAEDC